MSHLLCLTISGQGLSLSGGARRAAASGEVVFDPFLQRSLVCQAGEKFALSAENRKIVSINENRLVNLPRTAM